MRPKSVVALTDDQRADLGRRFAGPLTFRQRNRVPVLLRSAAGDTDAEMADDLGITTDTVAAVRRQVVAGGLDAALTERPRPGGPPALDRKAEAVLIALACSPAPEGRTT